MKIGALLVNPSYQYLICVAAANTCLPRSSQSRKANDDQRRDGKGNLQGGLAANLYACALRGGANTLTAQVFPVFCLTRTLSIAMY